MEPQRTTVFMNGRSQAVRIPTQFRFSGAAVYIRRDPRNGDVILSEGPSSLREILAALHALDVPDDFLSPSERAQTPPQERSKG